MEKEQSKALEFALSQIEKAHGKGSIMKLGEAPNQEFSIVNSGALSLDLALGVGGYPKGRIIEIFGPESSGKTTLALHAVAQAQKQGGVCAYIDNPDIEVSEGSDEFRIDTESDNQLDFAVKLLNG